ncbi:MAG: hypothetical protein ACFE95_02665 [Candidatus Hodarchaeota archaeon]
MIVRARTKELIIWHCGNLKEKCDYFSISMGSFDIWIVLFRLLGFKCVRLWIGTDVYKCKFWDYRVRARLLSYFCTNVTVAPWLAEELLNYGIKAEAGIHSEYIGVHPKKGN